MKVVFKKIDIFLFIMILVGALIVGTYLHYPPYGIPDPLHKAFFKIGTLYGLIGVYEIFRVIKAKQGASLGKAATLLLIGGAINGGSILNSAIGGMLF